MTNYRLSLFATTLLYASVASPAGAQSFCADLRQLSALVTDCQLNNYYSKAARACVAKLEKEIVAQQNLLGAAMLLSDAAAGSSQSARFSNSAGDLARMQTTLADLENEARKAREEIVAYSENFTFVASLSRDFARRYHMEAYLSHFSCYSENQAILYDEVKGIDTRIADLDKAVKSAAAMASINKTNGSRLDASSNNPVAHGRAPASAGPVPKGTPTQGPSSITGTEKIQADDRALQNVEKAKP